MKPLFFEPGTTHEGPPLNTFESPAKSRYQRPKDYIDHPDAIVIGSGIGGMGIASLLAQKRGMRVLLLEANVVPGGCTHCHEIDGFEFPTGLDSVGDMDPRIGRGVYRPAIDLITGGALAWAKMPDAHEVACFGDDVFQWFSSPEKNIEWAERLFPGEGNVRDYYSLEEKVEWWATFWAATKLWPEAIPVAVRESVYRATGGKWRTYMQRSVNEVFRGELGFSERLAAVFSYMYGNHGRTPDHAPFAFHAVNLFHYRWGAYSPVGGSGQIAECIVPIIERAGGQVAVSSPVARILVEKDRAVGVRLEDGAEIRSKLVISDASAHTTFVDLLDPELSEKHGYRQRFDEIGPSPSHVYLLLGYDEAVDVTQQVIWHMPSYEGVSKWDLSKADDLYKKQMKLDGMGGYVLSPSARDPLHAQRYPDKTTVVALAEGIPAWVDRAKRDPAFVEDFRRSATENLLKIVHRHMPELKGKTPKVLRAGIPMGCNPRAWAGCSLGLEPSGDRFVRHTHWLRPRTSIDGLWLTGQDSFSAGFAGSMMSSFISYSAITGDWFASLKPGGFFPA
jgi:all-trans-retinol 13,14-reductase